MGNKSIPVNLTLQCDVEVAYPMSVTKTNDVFLNAFAAGLSAVADIYVIYFALMRGTRARGTGLTARLIAFMAIADLIGQASVMTSNLPYSQPPEFLCGLQAFGVWYGAMATWLWAFVYAHTVRVCFADCVLSGREPDSTVREHRRREGCFHALCWGTAAVAVGAAWATSQFGPREDMPNCSFRDPRVSAYYEIVLIAALAYSAVCFITVHFHVRRALRVVPAGLLDVDTHVALKRRMRVWPRFMLYMLAFFVSQTPTEVLHVLQVRHRKRHPHHSREPRPDPHASSPLLSSPLLPPLPHSMLRFCWQMLCVPREFFALQLQPMADGLCQSLGFFNGVIFAWLNHGGACRDCVARRCGQTRESSRERQEQGSLKYFQAQVLQDNPVAPVEGPSATSSEPSTTPRSAESSERGAEDIGPAAA